MTQEERREVQETGFRKCAHGCGLAAAMGDIFCPGCREGWDRVEEVEVLFYEDIGFDRDEARDYEEGA